MTVKVYDTIAPPFGAWGPWVTLDAVWNGSDKPYKLAINSWQVDHLSAAAYNGQLWWHQKADDKEAHLTTFVGGYINVDLPAETVQEPKIRFTNLGVAPMLIRFAVGALIVLPGYKGTSPPLKPFRDQIISRDAPPPLMQAWMTARARAATG